VGGQLGGQFAWCASTKDELNLPFNNPAAICEFNVIGFASRWPHPLGGHGNPFDTDAPSAIAIK
jgi:hypothetical protein